MKNLIINTVDSKTGKNSKREMTAEEISQYEASLEAWKAQQAEQAAKEAARQSALHKLAALGLSPEEIAAITGA